MPDVSMILGQPPKIFQIGGFQVAYLQNNSYLTTIQILTRVGSACETDDEQGIAHILEHMFFKGSTKRPGGTTIARAANDIGAQMNAYTTYDHTAYYVTVLNDSFEEGFDILADMFLNPIFPADEFRKELNPILSEFRERDDDPDDFINERAMEAYYGSKYHPIIGTEQSILKATTDDMHRFKNLYYGGENTLIVIEGGVDEYRLIRALHLHFDTNRKCNLPTMPSLTETAGNVELSRGGIQEAYFNLYFPALPYNHEKRHQQDMMNYILGGTDSSLLFEHIREEMGLSCYGIYSTVSRNQSFNHINISCGIAPIELGILEKEVNHIIEKICNDKLDEHHLKRARASIRSAIASRIETSRGMASMISVPILQGETEDPVKKALREIDEVTLDDVRDAAQTTFAGAKMRAVLLPSQSDDDDD